ncbi:MAG TPA: hypothetical protein VGO40_04370 [Longimicrobium sp.]|jgi:hypothetical protein|nr:hypothetical protein [Longimicrobium sp.]
MLLLAGRTSLAGQGQPYSRDDVLVLVQGGVTAQRAVALIGSDCISFRLDSGTLQALAAAGADRESLSVLRSVCYAPPILRFQTVDGEIPLDPASVEPHTLIYLIRSGNRPIATAAEIISRQVFGTQNVFAVSGSATGPDIEIKYELIFDRRTYSPIRVVFDRRVGSRRDRLGLERRGDNMVGPVSGLFGLPRNVTLPAPRGTILPGMHEMLIAAANLEDVREFTLRSFDYHARPCALTISVRGERPVTVRVGTFDAYALDIHGCEEDQQAFVRKSAPHILLRQVFRDSETELIEIRPGDPAANHGR